MLLLVKCFQIVFIHKCYSVLPTTIIIIYNNRYVLVKMAIPELKNLRVNRLDFESKQVIGKGHFGEVELVVEKHTNDTYAMKVLKKENLLNQRDVRIKNNNLST